MTLHYLQATVCAALGAAVVLYAAAMYFLHCRSKWHKRRQRSHHADWHAHQKDR